MTACISNRVTQTAGLKLHVPPGATILFDRVEGFSERDSELFYQLFSVKISDCYSSQFVSYLDYEFKASGYHPMSLRSDSLTLLSAGKVSGADFILFVSIVGSSTSFEFFQKNRLTGRDIFLPHRNGATYFELVSLSNPQFSWSFTVETDIGPVVHDGAAVLLAANLATEENAVKKSFLKGLRELNAEVLKNCE